MIQVGFGLHCFTRECKPDDPESEFYRDDREERTFDYGRYELSKHLKQIAQSLDRRRCEFGRQDNFLTVDLVTHQDVQVRYGVFFNLRKLRGNEVLLVIQSAYELNPTKPVPRIGKIGFKVLVGHTLRGDQAEATVALVDAEKAKAPLVTGLRSLGPITRTGRNHH